MEMLGRYVIIGLQTWEKWNAIRITGLSGLGKTRLALEAFRPPDDRADIEQVSISDSVFYYQDGFYTILKGNAP